MSEPQPKTDFLIVDDDHMFASVLARAINKRDHTAKVVFSATEAKTLIKTHKFNKAILDLKINNESGLTLIPELKHHNPNISIVILTGYSSISTTVNAIKLGAVNYLCKPADTDEILAAFEHQSGTPEAELTNKPLSIERLEWEHIQYTLKSNNGNISATARSLGMHRRTLQRKLQKRPVKK